MVLVGEEDLDEGVTKVFRKCSGNGVAAPLALTLDRF